MAAANNRKGKGSPLAGLTVLCIPIAMYMGFTTGAGMHGEYSATEVMAAGAALLAVLFCAGKWANSRHSAELETIRQRRETKQALATRYNTEIKRLHGEFQAGAGSTPKTLAEVLLPGEPQAKQLRKEYVRKYDTLRQRYNSEVQALEQQWSGSTQQLHIGRIWQWIVSAGFVVLFFSGCFAMGVETEPKQPGSMAALMDQRAWNATNIPMPHLQDHSLYVSDPDSILSPAVVDSMNVVLLQLDDEKDVESAFVIVGHIEGDDPFRLAQDIGNTYGVGRNDRGLVVVVGYLDHSYFIAPGRALEGDLTDLECNHLAEEYLIPSMRAEQPDSGMLYLARGIYALMAEKEMPVMTALTGSGGDDDSSAMGFVAFPLLLVAWLVVAVKAARRVSTTYGLAALMANPFVVQPTAFVGGGGSGGGGHFSGGGGGFSGGGGGYGGGSFGGGGAGGRW